MARRTSEASNKSAGSQNNEGQSETRTASKASVSKGNGLSLRQPQRPKKKKKDTPRRAVQLANKGPGAGAEATGETLMS